MSVPDFQTLMKPLLELAAKGEVKLSSAEDAMADKFQLTGEDRKAMVPSGTMTYIRTRISWVLSDLTKAGLLQRPKRGVYNITAKGKEVLANNPAIINRKFLLSLSDSKDNSQIKIENIPQTPEEELYAASQKINENLREELLEIIMKNSPQFFEALIIELLLKMGYGGGIRENVAQQLGKSGDGGIDGIINEDILGLERIYIQAKRHEAVIGRPVVQGFVGSLLPHGANKGVFVTTSHFSMEAKDYITKIPQRVILIDGEKLTELMLRYNVGVITNQTIEIKKIDENFFEDH